MEIENVLESHSTHEEKTEPDNADCIERENTNLNACIALQESAAVCHSESHNEPTNSQNEFVESHSDHTESYNKHTDPQNELTESHNEHTESLNEHSESHNEPISESKQDKNDIVVDKTEHLNSKNCEEVMNQSEESGKQNLNTINCCVETEIQSIVKSDDVEEHNQLTNESEVMDGPTLNCNSTFLEAETIHECCQNNLEEHAMDIEETERDVLVFSEEVACESNDDQSRNDNGINKYSSENYLEIANITKPFENTILKGCKWSPDGSCLLANSDDNHLRLFDLPVPLYTKKVWKASEDKSFDIPVSLKVAEGGSIYDYVWYPHMSSHNPLTCCFLSSSFGNPVHLWNAYTGGLEASYRCYDYADEVVNAVGVAFNLSGDKIFCGLRNQVKIFRTDVPGKDSTTINLKAISKQRGIVSSIAFNPALPQVFAIGTYNKSVGIYTEDGSNLCVLYGHRGGITHLSFSKDGSKLFSGGRKDREILCWDLRKPGCILCSLPRSVFTHQRIYFDLTPEGNYILTGNTNGNVSVWDIESLPKVSSKETEVLPMMTFKAHKDCTNGCSVNPQFPILATASGKWRFAELASDDKGDEFFDLEYRRQLAGNSVKLWWMGKVGSS